MLGAEPSERTDQRRGYRAGYYHRGLVTRIGKLELRVPRDRNGEFSTSSVRAVPKLVFPNGDSCLRLIGALYVETHEGWLEDSRYLNVSLLTEHKRELLKSAA